MQPPLYYYFIFIHVSGKSIKLNAADIIMFRSTNSHYIKVITKKQNYMVRSQMNDLEATLFPQVFVRLHRSCIVNLMYLDVIDKTHAIILNESVPVQKEYITKIFNQITYLN